MTLEEIGYKLDKMDIKLDGLDEKLDGVDKKTLVCETNLTNHLSHHGRIERYIAYPLGVAAIMGIAGFLVKLILHI